MSSTSTNYIHNVVQTNGCRTWTNPLAGTVMSPPSKPTELYIKQIPRFGCTEQDILPFFARFGEIYEFRLLIDYEGHNRGFAYLIYFHEKAALACLDCMGYFIIRPGVMLDVTVSEQRSSLVAMGIPWQVEDDAIVMGLKQTFCGVQRVLVQRQDNLVAAILLFPDHDSALQAKRWCGAGSINLWNRHIKILWGKMKEIELLENPCNAIKHVLLHNMPEDYDADELGCRMMEVVDEKRIVSIRPMHTDWLVELTDPEAAMRVFASMKSKFIKNQPLLPELVDSKRLKVIKSYADFDFELRCLCFANGWSPPIFIYGSIIKLTCTQFVACIMRNNHDTSYTTILMEVSYEKLYEIHSKVCEALMLLLIELKSFPSKSFIVKMSASVAFVVGYIPNLFEPHIIYSSLVTTKESISICLTEILDLAGMCCRLVMLLQKEDASGDGQAKLFDQYMQILRSNDPNHQFISDVELKYFVLGCINPRYRGGKPLKFGIPSREMILVMYNALIRTNVSNNTIPEVVDCKTFPLSDYSGFPSMEKFDLLPVGATQVEYWHFVKRPVIEFNYTDTFSSLYKAIVAVYGGPNQQ